MAVTINGASPTTAQQREFAAAMGLPVLLQTVTAASAQQDIDFTGLDFDADGTYRIELSMVANAAADQTVNLFYNADLTAANYEAQSYAARGATVSAGRLASAYAFFGYSAGNIATVLTGVATLSKVAGKSPSLVSECIAMESAAINRIGIAQRWSGTANVTSIKLRHANNFGVGTVAKIYKV